MAKKKKRVVRKQPSKSIVSDDLFIPNHSGMLDAGEVHRTPTDDLDPVNKKYVDDETHWERTGTNVHLKTSTDNVGIGTTGPNTRLGQKLDIATSANYGGAVLSTWSTVNSHTSLLDFTKSGHATIGSHTAVENGEMLGSIEFRGSDGVEFLSAASIMGQIDGAVAGGGTNDMPGRIIFSTTADGEESVTERMRITSTGNVGIGTTAPNVPLHLEKEGEALAGTGYYNLWAEAGTGANLGVLLGYDTSGQIGIIGPSGASGNLAFWTHDGSAWGERVRIQNDGNVGIGTTTPATSAKLDLTSTTGALLLTRMTTAQRDALTAVNGMILYNTTLNKVQVYEGGAWASVI